MTSLKIPASLRALGEINEYSDEAAKRKNNLHVKGKTFLKALAAELNLGAKDYDLRSNKAGIAVAGEVTLHADGIYLQLSDSFSAPPCVQLLYRTCKGRADYTGGQNHFVKLPQLAEPSEVSRLIENIKRIMK